MSRSRNSEKGPGKRDRGLLDSIILFVPVIVVAFALREVVGFGEGLLDFVILLCVVSVLTVLWGLALGAIRGDGE